MSTGESIARESSGFRRIEAALQNASAAFRTPGRRFETVGPIEDEPTEPDMKTTIRTRLSALAASVVVTFAVFAGLADYGLPAMAPAAAIVIAQNG